MRQNTGKILKGAESMGLGRQSNGSLRGFGSGNALRDQLRGKRREMSWGQRELAAHLGVDGKTITHWEHGGTILRRSHRVAVARFLGIEEEQFMAQMGSRWSASHGKQSA